MANAEVRKPHYDWFHVPLQILVGSFCVYSFWRPPGPNKSMLVLAGVVAVMTLLDMRPVHKAIYFILIVLLLVIENHAINKEQSDFAKAEEARNQQFKEIVDDITGGDSYTYVAANMGVRPPFQLSVWVKGKHGVHDVSAEVQQYFGSDPASIKRQLHSIHSLSLGAGEFLPGVTPIGEYVVPGRYSIRISTRNSDIREQIDIARCSNGQWDEAIKMNGPGQADNETWKGLPNCHHTF